MCSNDIYHVFFRLWPGDRAGSYTGGGGSKGTINWPETEHSGICPRAKKQ